MDPPGNQILGPPAPGNNFIHARFAPEIKDGFVQWLTKNTTRYIVAEETASRLHYHACFETPLIVRSIQSRLKGLAEAAGCKTTQGKANAYYGAVKECSDASYVCKEGKIIATNGYLDQTITDLIKEGQKYIKKPIPIIATNPTGPTVTYGTPAKKSVSMKAQFVRYLEDEHQWRENSSINLSNYHQQLDELIDLLTVFWKNAFTTPQGCVCVEHAKWHFADDDIRDKIKWDNRAALKKSLR